MAYAAVRDHKGDYGIDRSFHRISARSQAIAILIYWWWCQPIGPEW